MSQRIQLVKPDPVTVEISDEMRARFEAVENTRNGREGRHWTPDEDAALLEFYTKKNKDGLAAEFNTTAETMRKRYNKLIAMGGNNEAMD